MQSQSDHSRGAVLDGPMLDRVQSFKPMTLLDIGSGEGRFCRMVHALDTKTIGIDPTPELIGHAQSCHRDGMYIQAKAEALPIPDTSIDMAVFYLSLIDIPDYKAAICEASRVLRPGGRILVANLAGFITAARHDGWQRDGNTAANIHLTGYLDEDVFWTHWRGIRIQNWHRPPSSYMQAFLGESLSLTHYDEPRSTHPDEAIRARYDNVAYLTITEWEKPT